MFVLYLYLAGLVVYPLCYYIAQLYASKGEWNLVVWLRSWKTDPQWAGLCALVVGLWPLKVVQMLYRYIRQPKAPNGAC